jgi:hypothetical protein
VNHPFHDLRELITSTGRGTFFSSLPYPLPEDVMKAYFANLPTKTWLLLVVPAVALAYPIATMVLPAVLRAVVPEVVRSVLSVI